MSNKRKRLVPENQQPKTSIVTLLSSTHGRMRRKQRDIDKRDLQKALKHGTFTRMYHPTEGHRWKCEYDGIIFITDSKRKREITAFPSPLALAPVDEDEETAHKKAKDILSEKRNEVVTHTVIVMDQSGSMLTHDIQHHRDRHTAAYSSVALELLAEQIFNGTANNRDLVSLIEFDRDARVIFSLEPVSWILYNKVLGRRDDRSFKERKEKEINDMYDSNYQPALDKAYELLETSLNEDCALSLLFLSDGRPSDAWSFGYTPHGMERMLCSRCEGIAKRFGDQLSCNFIGFGNNESDFSILQSMANAVNKKACGASASFIYCDKMANNLQTAISTTITNLTKTKCNLLTSHEYGTTKRQIAAEQYGNRFEDWQTYTITHHLIYNPHTGDFQPVKGIPPGALAGYNQELVSNLSWSSSCPYLAISPKSVGEGAERVAFRCSLADSKRTRYGEMVAKETNLVERIPENETFHKTFLETQSLASYLAKEFNKRLRGLPDYDEQATPQLSFVSCSVLLIEDSNWPGGTKRGVLVEKMLDVENLKWSKWNNNAGAVEGMIRHNPLNVSDQKRGSADEEDTNDEITPSEFLQAFSHFTYTFTNKKLLVCDLQGTYDTDAKPPTFELTDPAIHYQTKSKDKQMVFGRTDKGSRGIQLFFNTHKCNRVCQVMQLCKPQKDWKQKWKSECGVGEDKAFQQQPSQPRQMYNVIDLTADETKTHHLIDLTEDDDLPKINRSCNQGIFKRSKRNPCN